MYRIIAYSPAAAGRQRAIRIVTRCGTRHNANTPNTIANHVSNIFSKLQVASRPEAIVKARNAGLGVPKDRPNPG